MAVMAIVPGARFDLHPLNVGLNMVMARTIVSKVLFDFHSIIMCFNIHILGLNFKIEFVKAFVITYIEKIDSN